VFDSHLKDIASGYELRRRVGRTRSVEGSTRPLGFFNLCVLDTLAQPYRLQRLPSLDAIGKCTADLRDESPLILGISQSS
jgi:hypothetical protein